MEIKHPISGIKDDLDVDFRSRPPAAGPAPTEDKPTAFQQEAAVAYKKVRDAEKEQIVQGFAGPAKTGFEAEMQARANGGRTPLDVQESAEHYLEETTADPLEVVARMKNDPLPTESSPTSPAPSESATSASAEKATPTPATPSVSASPKSEPKKS